MYHKPTLLNILQLTLRCNAHVHTRQPEQLQTHSDNQPKGLSNHQLQQPTTHPKRTTPASQHETEHITETNSETSDNRREMKQSRKLRNAGTFRAGAEALPGGGSLRGAEAAADFTPQARECPGRGPFHPGGTFSEQAHQDDTEDDKYSPKQQQLHHETSHTPAQTHF